MATIEGNITTKPQGIVSSDRFALLLVCALTVLGVAGLLAMIG